MCEVLTYPDFAAALEHHDWRGALCSDALMQEEKELLHLAVKKGGLWLFMFERHIEDRRQQIIVAA